MKTILLQGDSITDMGHSRTDEINKGYGYSTLLAGKIAYNYVGKYNVLNRGISGNRVVDLYSRIKRDCINLKPDYMSILIGVNDVWHELAEENGVSADKFKKIYEMYISEIKEALPEIKIIILEPFVLNGSATTEKYDLFRSEVELRAKKAREVANEFSLPFVELQKKLDELAEKVPVEQILYDGVHPNILGASLISEELFNTYKAIL